MTLMHDAEYEECERAYLKLKAIPLRLLLVLVVLGLVGWLVDRYITTLKADLASERAHSKEMFYRLEFRNSLALTYNDPPLFFEVTQLRVLDEFPDAEKKFELFRQNLPANLTQSEKALRHVYHTADRASVQSIAKHGLRPSQCRMCRGLDAWYSHDDGWFGVHTQGVYVSKHADYTTYYSSGAAPVPGDVGQTVILKMVAGRTKRFIGSPGSIPPAPGFDCHVSTNDLEFFVFDEETRAEPPRATYRAIPVAIVDWRVIRSRGGIEHDR